MTHIELQQTIVRVLDGNPDLTIYGIGTPDPDSKHLRQRGRLPYLDNDGRRAAGVGARIYDKTARKLN